MLLHDVRYRFDCFAWHIIPLIEIAAFAVGEEA
jgi:hypothetical protein